MKLSAEDRLDIWLSIAFEGSARLALQYEQYYGGAAEVREAILGGHAELSGRMTAKHKALVSASAGDAYLDDFISKLEKTGISAVTRHDPNYPYLLKEIADPPFVLYALGREAGKPIVNPLAVIGTRRCTDYGAKVARMMGKALADSGFTVISGLAPGCDSLSHEGALSSGAEFPTAAVLGQGLLVPKNDGTAQTMERILERGVVLSEYLPETQASKYTFPMRNRIISGISTGVLVVEAGKKSGTMITVDCALEQGRNVYAVPCRITEVYNCGTNDMLRQGIAQPVYSEEDLLLRLGADLRYSEPSVDPITLIKDPGMKQLFELIALGEKSFDDLFEISGLSVEQLNMHLTEMEFSGLIKQLPGRVYTLN